MSSRFDAVYKYCPIWLQNLMISAYGIRLRKQRYGAAYREAFHYYSTKDYARAEEEAVHQVRELRRLVRHAKINSPFYAVKLASVDPDEIRSVDDLKSLPMVAKEEFRSNIESIYTIGPGDGIEAFTGGTTGKSLRVYYTKADMQKRMAYLDAFKVRCGIDPFRAKKATFSGRSFATGLFQGSRKVFWRHNFAYRQRLYSTFDLSQENLPHYIDDLNRFRPEVINGFVSAIHQLARFVIDAGRPLSFVPKAIFTTSETLLPHHREVIEKAFGAKVFNQYASAEGAPFITECREGHLHYNIDTGVIENIETADGIQTLVTSFTTYGTPLIRYAIGDVVVFGTGSCACGSSHPLVERIEGRCVDYLFSPERGRVSLSHLADVIKGLPNCVKEMQFVQESRDAIIVKIVADESLFDVSAEEKILAQMRYRFGAGMDISIDRVAMISREASGKFSLIKHSAAAKMEQRF